MPFSLHGRTKAVLFLFSLTTQMIMVVAASDNSSTSMDTLHQGDMDILSPYISQHGPKYQTHQNLQSCQNVTYGNVTHSLYPAAKHPMAELPLVETFYKMKQIGYAWEKQYVNIHHFIVNNPLTSLSVVEPDHIGACGAKPGTRATVRESSRQKNCIASVNAGFFNTHTGECLGNIIRDSFLVRDSGGIQNAHFGITDTGNIFTGYLSELDLLTQGFQQLVGGVIWLVRDGKNYVQESKNLECSDTEETGSIDRFANVISARTSVGHDKEGRVHMVQVNGKTDLFGIDLSTLADTLIEYGIVNAINLDGGGSSTAVVNGTMISFPSDKCPDQINSCERAVSTILCAHEPICPDGCSGHGVCQVGVCQCHKPWTGHTCNTFEPSKNCSHGTLFADYCLCDKGWMGENCTKPCPQGSYGQNCSQTCLCATAEECDVITGVCHCSPGHIGKYCEKKCPYGYYGKNCAEICFCRDSCFCDPVSGSCNVTDGTEDYIRAGNCVARKRIAEEQLIPDRHDQYSMCLTSLICLTIVATASLILNAVFSAMMLRQKLQRKENGLQPEIETFKMKRIRRRRQQKKKKPRSLFFPTISSSSDVESLVANGVVRKGVLEDDIATLTGSGEDEEDSFLSRKTSAIS